MICAYDRARFLTRVVLQDGIVFAAMVLAAWTGGPWGAALATGALASFAWAVVTLHFPSRVELTDDGVSFFAYGRRHLFLWRNVARVKVRRFLVRDRVLVRIAPASAWRGRYWLTDGLGNYAPLVAELERRAASAQT